MGCWTRCSVGSCVCSSQVPDLQEGYFVIRVVGVPVGYWVEPPSLSGPKVGLIVHEGACMRSTLGCCLGQQVLGDAAQQLVHTLCCVGSIAAALKS